MDKNNTIIIFISLSRRQNTPSNRATGVPVLCQLKTSPTIRKVNEILTGEITIIVYTCLSLICILSFFSSRFSVPVWKSGKKLYIVKQTQVLRYQVLSNTGRNRGVKVRHLESSFSPAHVFTLELLINQLFISGCVFLGQSCMK